MNEICTVLHTEDGRVLGIQYPKLIDSTEGLGELLHLLDGKSKYFERYELVLAVPVGFGIASVLDDEKKPMDNYPFLRLMISEDFPNLIDGSKNRLLNHLCTRYKVWLGNLGSGTRTNLVAVMEHCFDGLVLDRTFTQANADKGIFPVMLREIQKYTTHLIVPGISTGRYRPIRLKHIEQLI